MVAMPMIDARKRLTLADYEALPDDQDYEIIDGRLYVAPRARPEHQRIAAKLTARLIADLEDRGKGTVVPDADLIHNERSDYVSPDIMYFEGDRYRREINPREMIRAIPDLVIEVLSPSTSLYDLNTKRTLYERLGVKHYWITDGDRRRLHELVLGDDATYRERIVGENEAFRPAAFPDLEIDLKRIFE